MRLFMVGGPRCRCVLIFRFNGEWQFMSKALRVGVTWQRAGPSRQRFDHALVAWRPCSFGMAMVRSIDREKLL